MKKMEAEHGVLVNCNNEGKDRRRKIVDMEEPTFHV